MVDPVLVIAVAAGSAVSIMCTLSVYWGLIAVRKFKGEFGECIRWITYGLVLLLIAVALSSTVSWFESTSRLVVTILVSGALTSAFSMILVGYKKVYDLISQIA